MANFSKSIGGSYGSGPINAESVGLSQATGGPVGGYSGTKGTGAGAVPSQGGALPQATPKENRPDNKTNATHARSDGKPMPKPSKTRA